VYYGTGMLLGHGFYADKDGNIYVSQYETGHHMALRFDTGLDLPAKNVNIRMVVNDSFEVEVYVNGKSAAKFPTTSRTGSQGTYKFLTATTRRDLTATRKNDVVLHDFILTQQAPAAKLTAGQLAQNGVLTIDGNLAENYWTPDTMVGNTKLAALCDEEYLYIALDTKESDATFDFGDIKGVAKLGKKPTFALGYTMGSTIAGNGKGQYEIRIPLNLISQPAPAGQSVPISITSGGKTRQFQLILGGGAKLQQLMYAPTAGDGKNDATAYLDAAGLTLDGLLKDNQWYTPHRAAGTGKAPGAEAGFLWDARNLYVGAQIFTDSRAKAVTLTVNGKTVAADLIDEKADAGQVRASGQTMEWSVPLSAFNISEGMNAKVPYRLEFVDVGGTSVLYGTLELVGRTVILGDTASDIMTKNYVLGSNAANTTWGQGDGAYAIRTGDGIGQANELVEHYVKVDYVSGAYDLTVDLYVDTLPTVSGSHGWRGLGWEFRQETLQARFCLRDDGKGNIIMDLLRQNGSESADIGVDVGTRFTLTISVDNKRVPSVYVNGELAYVFTALDRTDFFVGTAPLPRLIMDAVNYTRMANEAGVWTNVNADIYSILWTQASFESDQSIADTAIEAITAADILAGAQTEDVTALNLVKEIEVAALGLSIPVKWTAVDKATGQVAANVNTETGIVTRSTKPLSFDLTASINYNGAGASKTFTFGTKGQSATGNVSLIVQDENPFTGQANDFTVNVYEYFDTTHNSLVVDQGSSKPFNTIKLYDMDEYSRMSRQHLGVFISEDGKDWTKLTDWMLHKGGKEYTLYNLNAKARYVKVHTYHDELDITGEVPSFYNSIQEMIAVSNEPYLPGAGGAFAHKAEVKVSDSDKDVPVFVSIASLGAKSGQYKADGSDFRFTVGETTLAHWYNGTDGFYVRVPSAPATVTAHWGCGSAKDFSDSEAVFEVSYGNVTLVNVTKQTYSTATDDAMAGGGRPFTFPNGDVIVVGRSILENCHIPVYRSTDGGRTFDPTPVMALNDWDENKKSLSGGRGSGFGGFLWDEELNRLFLIAYSGKSGATDTDYRIVLIYTDDYGYTWSEPQYISYEFFPKVKENDIILGNPQPDRLRHMTYSDGIKLRDADGDGPNVDYVFMHANAMWEADQNVSSAMFSADGGKSWTESKDILTLNTPIVGPASPLGKELDSRENGCTEACVIQLDDGSLYALVRAQQAGSFYLLEGRSYDYGNTWTTGYSKIISANCSTVLTEYGSDRLVLHASRNSIGMSAYRRTPLSLGVTSDNFESFDHYLNLIFGTSFDSLQYNDLRVTQQGIGFSPDGNEAFICWTDANYKDPTFESSQRTIGCLIEEFDEMVYGNKGGYDDFEAASLKYQGWMSDSSDTLELTQTASVSGKRAMKVRDTSMSVAATAVRQVPAMKAGTVGAKVMVPTTNKNEFVLEVKAAFNFSYLRHALAAVAIAPDGTVSLCYKEGQKAVAKVEPGTWNDIAISFNIAADMGKLYINGKAVCDIKLETSQLMTPLTRDGYVDILHEDVVREICAIQFNQSEATAATGDCLYVDDFYAVELTKPLNRPADNISFSDVKKGDWYYDAVSFAVENGIMSGYNATKFGPNDTLNRAMVVQVLYNKEGQPALNGLKHSFSDVPASQWFNNAVTWGSNRGVVSGFGGGVFKPEDAVTIEQVAVILWNYSNTPAGFGDLSKVGNHSDWAANALKWAVEKGILNNVPFTNATEKATRAQTAQILTNYLRGN